MVNVLDLIGRILISALFLISAYNKIFNLDGSMGWMEGFGVPGFLLTPVIILEIIAPLMIIFGYKIKIAAVVLSIFCFATAIIFLNDFPNQIISFSKNLALAGGLIFLAINESGSLSIDKKFKK